MGIAAGVVAHRPAPSRLRWLRERKRRPTFPRGDRPSGCSWNENRQKPPPFRLLGTGLGGCRRAAASALSRRTPGCARGGSRAEPFLRGRLLGKGRLIEPKSPPRQNARVRTGIGKKPKTCRWCLRATAPENSHCRPTLDIVRPQREWLDIGGSASRAATGLRG